MRELIAVDIDLQAARAGLGRVEISPLEGLHFSDFRRHHRRARKVIRTHEQRCISTTCVARR